MKKSIGSIVGLAVLMAMGIGTGYAEVYFQDDFNTGGTAGALSRGWQFIENEHVTEVGSNFVIAPEWPEGQDGPGTNTGFIAPPKEDGTASEGGFLIADSDAGSGSDDIGSEAEIWAISPPFSTTGANQVWLHANIEIVTNNNGESIQLIQCSYDGGNTWVNVWAGPEPERVIDSFNTGIDGAALIGGWPVLGSGSLTKSFGGLHGRVHFQLPAEAANKPDVRVRFGWYESADAWWIAVDDLVIDNVPAPTGTHEIFKEDFSNGIPSTWSNKNLHTNRPDGIGQVWDVRPLWFADADEPFKLVGGLAVNIDILKHAEAFGVTIDLNNPDPEINPKGLLDGRWVMMLAGQGYAMWQEGDNPPVDGKSESAALDTPSLDLSQATAVFLEFDSEVIVGNSTCKYEVFVSTDGGQNFSRLFTYTEALMNYAEAPYFMRHYLPVPDAAGKNNVIFRFLATGEDPGQMEGFWVIDNVRVTANVGASVPDWAQL